MKETSDEHIVRIRRNLCDAGCELSAITQFLDLEQRQCRREQYQLLSRQKAVLLQKLHQIQYKIDCLDHLVYIMQQEDKNERRYVLCKKRPL